MKIYIKISVCSRTQYNAQITMEVPVEERLMITSPVRNSYV